MVAALLAAEAVSPPFPHLLTALIVVPAIGALLVFLISAQRPDTCRQVAFLVSALTGVLSVYLLIKFQQTDGDFQFVEAATWLKTVGPPHDVSLIPGNHDERQALRAAVDGQAVLLRPQLRGAGIGRRGGLLADRKSTRLNSSHT